jgi:hypothetical protein
MKPPLLEAIERCADACAAIARIEPPDDAGDVARLANDAQLVMQRDPQLQRLSLTDAEQEAWSVAYRSVNSALITYRARYQRWEASTAVDAVVADSPSLRSAATAMFAGGRR